MFNDQERAQFLETGYLHVRGALEPEHVKRLQAEFDRVWELEGPPVSRSKLLKHRMFIELIEHPSIIDRQRALFGSQTQLLQYDLLRQGPRSDMPARFWHRDFVFPGNLPLAVNAILYFDEMTAERGPTHVLPGSHIGTQLPPPSQVGDRLPGEVPVNAAAGDVVFINGAIWHTGSRNNSDSFRRAAYLYYGYWWLKRYAEHEPMPTEALINADRQRLELLGVSMPGDDLHMYGQVRMKEFLANQRAKTASDP